MPAAIAGAESAERRMAESPVLLVEDDTDARDTLAELLTLYGFTVLEAKNGQAALDWLAFGPLPFVIITDLKMPVMDGWQFREQQRENCEWSSIPIVVLSGTTGELRTKELFQGATVFTKPLRFEQLLDVLSALKSEGSLPGPVDNAG